MNITISSRATVTVSITTITSLWNLGQSGKADYHKIGEELLEILAKQKETGCVTFGSTDAALFIELQEGGLMLQNLTNPIPDGR